MKNMDWFGNLMIWLIDNVVKRPIVFYTTVLIISVLLAYGGWHLERWINWDLAYGDDVQTVVCEMVKPEALKDPSVCEE